MIDAASTQLSLRAGIVALVALAPSQLRPDGPLPAAVEPEPETATLAAAEPAEPPTLVGKFKMTYYWIAELTGGEGPATRRIYDPSCRVIAKVPRKFARQMILEGTAKLPDGRVLNYHGSCGCRRSPCFVEVGAEAPWGLGVGHRALSPFRTVAVDPRVVRIGTVLYSPELDGLKMPGEAPWGGFVHDGCLVAADRGGGIKGRQIDFFAARRDYWNELRDEKLRRVHLYRDASHCEDEEPESPIMPRLRRLGRGVADKLRDAAASDV
jgi:3D (Asp-Asp-Asp) domain-containing protein